VVHGSWQLLTDDPDERAWFQDLGTVLRHAATPAGPKNRLRHVARLELGGRVYFCKTFVSTQWKNRVRFRCTAPVAKDDAQRECAVTEALRANGFAAPRPVARGREGPSSYYVCAELPGRSLTAVFAAGAGTAALAARAAEHCGRLLAAGFRLPDLGPDHVFVRGEAPAFEFAVLDLHNGGLARPGPAPGRLCRRVLRRFLRSSRGLPVTASMALRFAVRLLRAAGRGASVRAVLRSLAPFATAARYEVAGKSRAYAERNPARAARELALLARVWPGRPGETVLDLPCGAGRLLPLLRDRFGHRVVHADGALAMLCEARCSATSPPPSVLADALATPFADRCVDGVVMFRFLHHLPAEAAARALAEACRTARRFVVVSFFHPCSFHHLARLARHVGGRSPTRFTRTLGQVRRELERHGFLLHATAADLPFARDLWLASFVRR
jgi:SAM-dependent methyltransferase